MKASLAFLGAIAFAAHAGAGMLTVAVVDKDGKPVPDAVVVVQPAQRAGAVPVLPATATVLQEKMQFLPVMTIVAPGAKVSFVNNDNWDHHVRGTKAVALLAATPAGSGFELRIDGKKPAGVAKPHEVTVTEVGPVLLSCHLHGSMRGHLYVASSPWTAKTTAEGLAVFDSVPEGSAQVSVWHPEQLADLPASAVAVGAAPARASVQLQFVPRRRRT